MPDPSIRSWRNYPPQGGWPVTYHVPEMPGRSFAAPGGTPQQVITFIIGWRVNNNLPADEAQVFSQCNQEWCRRDPGRCTEPPPPPEPVAGAARRVLTPTDYGRACWTYLNTFGVSFNAGYFIATVHHTQSLLSPHNPHNNGSGCVVCNDHFNEFLAQYPPHKVQSAEQAAVWVWLAHDNANVYAGKAHRPSYRVAAATFGWVMLTPEQFSAIQTELRS